MPTVANETLSRRFGIELEFSCNTYSHQTVSQKITEAGIDHVDVGRYCHSNNNTSWELKLDGSCGFEFVSRVLSGKDGLDEAEAVVKKMETVFKNNPSLGFNVNTSCGFHVHVDVSDLTPRQIKNLVSLVYKHESAIYAMLPASRSNNSYCKPIRDSQQYRKLAFEANGARQIQAAVREAAYDRRFGLNLTNLIIHGRIEFRYGAGTMNAKKVKAWIVMLLGIVERAKEMRFNIGENAGQHANNTLEDVKNGLLKSVRSLNKYVGMKTEAIRASRYQTERFNHFTNEERRARTVA